MEALPDMYIYMIIAVAVGVGCVALTIFWIGGGKVGHMPGGLVNFLIKVTNWILPNFSLLVSLTLRDFSGGG